MADMVTVQELENAKIDARTIGESVNENKIVTPRYGAPFKSMPMIAKEMQGILGTIIAGGVPASVVLDGNQTQDEINLYGGKKYDMPTGGYPIGARVLLNDNVTEVVNKVASNQNNPNSNMTGWRVYSGSGFIVDNLTTNDSEKALSAKQGKDLQDSKIDKTQKGVANGVATLDANTKVLVAQLHTATEVVTGVAKIATTAIAKAGVNDTDFLTTKKLRDALNAGGEAPVAPLRGFVVFTDAGAAPVIVRAVNVVSVERVSTGNYKITTNTAVANAGILGFARSDSIYYDRSISVNQTSSDSIVGNVVPVRVAWAGATQAQAFNSPFVCVGIF